MERVKLGSTEFSVDEIVYEGNGVAVYVIDGVLSVDDGQNSEELPDTEENREKFIVEAKRLMTEWGNEHSMKMYVYKMVKSVEKSWDDVDFQRECEVVAVISGDSNKECETKAEDNGYGDTDIYGWTYNNDIPMAEEVAEC